MPALADGLESLCLRRALQEHLTIDSGWTEEWSKDPLRGRWPLFSVLKRRGATGALRCTALPLDASHAMSLLRPYFAAAGVRDPAGFTIHFGRATGSHVLTVGCGLDPQLANATGGWAAEKKDTMHAVYLQLSPADLLDAGHKAIVRARLGCGLCTFFCCSPLSPPPPPPPPSP